MASNPIPQNYPSLVLLSQRCANGAGSVGPAVPLLINTATTILADRSAALSAQLEYQTAKGQMPALSEAMQVARDDAATFCVNARNVLEFYLGAQHGQAWAPAGFTNSLAIPVKEAGLFALTQAMQGYLGTHQNYENSDLDVTTAESGTHVNNLTAARQALDAKRAEVTAKRQNRDAKVHALQKRLRGLCKELAQRLGPQDSRWRDFGLNMPGAASVPAVPRNVRVMALSDGRLHVECDRSANAAYYRFFYQRPIVDPGPLTAGNSAEPFFLIPNLTAGQVYLVYASAVNSGAESELSAPGSGTPVQAAAA